MVENTYGTSFARSEGSCWEAPVPLEPRPFQLASRAVLRRLEGRAPGARPLMWAFDWVDAFTSEVLLERLMEERSTEVHADLGLYGEHLALIDAGVPLGVGAIHPLEGGGLGPLARARTTTHARLAIHAAPEAPLGVVAAVASPTVSLPIVPGPWRRPRGGPSAVIHSRLRATSLAPEAEAILYLRVHLPVLQAEEGLVGAVQRSATLGPYGRERMLRVREGVGLLAAHGGRPGARLDLVAWELGVRLPAPSDKAARAWLSRVHALLMEAL